MTPAATAHPANTQHMSWIGKSEAWLDSKGKGAWIAAMVLGFVFFWPVGLALLFYMIWSKDMFKKSRSHGCGRSRRMHMMSTSGNSAFDSYRDETLRRLEDEQRSFEDFLQRLREAKDKAEFDDFMDERAKAAADPKETEDA
ncbi:hypothetical protein shim_11890 [Shimia sp. SK013]|uniref:DUF2852 domain-containing protein n=1 Tax=Shimia sp. SK013 TaxID=1389006 RepID=UPI0006B5674E|nr:DUF2852 domain-containing protein [Shimia sp. SK013]KPA22899.1 hypothetical protein shim_11890 [Shimia sp. SK013]